MLARPAMQEETSLQLDEIGQIALTAGDLSRARNFYQNILGMKLLFEAGGMIFFQCGAIRLLIGTAAESGPVGGTILYFKVPDLKAVHGSLQAKGVEFVQPPHLVARMPDHELWIAFLKDSEGNTLGLMSELRQPL